MKVNKDRRDTVQIAKRLVDRFLFLIVANVTRKIRVGCASCSPRTSCKCCVHLPREERATRDVTFGSLYINLWVHSTCDVATMWQKIQREDKHVNRYVNFERDRFFTQKHLWEKVVSLSESFILRQAISNMQLFTFGLSLETDWNVTTIWHIMFGYNSLLTRWGW
jgi:hypothetical protein